jgi:hypothetical protein
MALCPAGHQSQTTDYCDTCGAMMGGAPVTPAAASAAPGSVGAAPTGSAGSAGSAAAASSAGGSGQGAGGTCPQCGAERDGRFCEECGYDYEMAELVPPPVQTASPPPPAAAAAPEPSAPNQSQNQNRDPLAETAAMPPDYDFDAEFAKAEQEFAAGDGASADPDAESALSGSSPFAATVAPNAGAGANTEAPAGSGAAEAPVSEASAATSPRQLAVLVIADPEYYAAQVERGDIVEQEFPFPKYPGERRFALDADRFRIGRASASRGIAVEIDLTGPPLDPAVSHLHAQLLRVPDGSWAVVDLNSANGTRLNGAADPLPAETEVPVKAGDRIHVGVWTTLILEEA